jgi:hypothetical protein
MVLGFFQRLGWLDPGEAARRLHSRWLTRALKGERIYPRIPLRRVDDGGYGKMMQRPSGRAHADLWWAIALSRVDEEQDH